MLEKSVVQFIHDGLIFYYSVDALKRAHEKDLIGFYFDHMNLPQRILQGSMYAEHCYKNFNGN